MKRALTHSFLMFIALWSAAACSQGEGDPCQVTSDCSDGLICCPALQTPRGKCINEPRCPTNPVPPDSNDDAGEESEQSSSN